MKNIVYETKVLSSHYSSNRVAWGQFYPSEKKLLESIDLSSDGSVLDIGCGCGGLGLDLPSEFIASLEK